MTGGPGSADDQRDHDACPAERRPRAGIPTTCGTRWLARDLVERLLAPGRALRVERNEPEGRSLRALDGGGRTSKSTVAQRSLDKRLWNWRGENLSRHQPLLFSAFVPSQTNRRRINGRESLFPARHDRTPLKTKTPDAASFAARPEGTPLSQPRAEVGEYNEPSAALGQKPPQTLPAPTGRP